VVRDEEGDEFPDLAAAIQEAALIARELLDDDEAPMMEFASSPGERRD
jgi:hypothetical protein